MAETLRFFSLFKCGVRSSVERFFFQMLLSLVVVDIIWFEAIRCACCCTLSSFEREDIRVDLEYTDNESLEVEKSSKKCE